MAFWLSDPSFGLLPTKTVGYMPVLGRQIKRLTALSFSLSLSLFLSLLSPCSLLALCSCRVSFSCFVFLCALFLSGGGCPCFAPGLWAFLPRSPREKSGSETTYGSATKLQKPWFRN